MGVRINNFLVVILKYKIQCEIMNINDIILNKQFVFYNVDGKLVNLLSFFIIILISFYFYINEKEFYVRI